MRFEKTMVSNALGRWRTLKSPSIEILTKSHTIRTPQSRQFLHRTSQLRPSRLRDKVPIIGDRAKIRPAWEIGQVFERTGQQSRHYSTIVTSPGSNSWNIFEKSFGSEYKPRKKKRYSSEKAKIARKPVQSAIKGDMEDQSNIKNGLHEFKPREKRPYPGAKSNLSQKRAQKKSKKKKRERDMNSGSHEEVLGIDIRNLKISLDDAKADDDHVAEQPLPEPGSEIDVKVVELSSTGDALALQEGSSQIYVVPFAVPGDVVKVKVYRHLEEEGYTAADFISVVTPSEMRDDSRIRCKYFASCAGCQFQMLDYPEQLRLKKRIVEKAFKNFSELPPELIPAIQDTIGSPLQYGYRTKLTPHFDGPQGWSRKNPDARFAERPPIGFTPKGKRTTLDIEDCPIGTDAVRAGMKSERERMAVEFGDYKRGATILLRESTVRVPKDSSDEGTKIPENAIKSEAETYTDYKTCVTDNKGTSTDYIDSFLFTNPAGSFFQNNNSILSPFTAYIRSHVMPPSSPSTPQIKNLIDAYSGSGLFTITLSSLFQGSTGIDISPASIEHARKNAEANGMAPDQANFIAADAGELFKSVTYTADETVVILDPPRKGCDTNFLGQLLEFGPKRIVYVSCNVHTQARDVGMLVRGHTGVEEESGKGEGMARYEIESLRGFDFFPQTGHVEGVAVLNRVEGA
ncbi:S-adenosyl-L-methionine-dependent methyltransferase [Xylariaceae sp. FL1272]|nr:S-adenosyl-L-methionine-dependent methyltransferase [Xylariaceae sp. FL1272]